jgi:hypothetical protein
MFFDSMPMWGVLVSSLLLSFISLEIGVRFGNVR